MRSSTATHLTNRDAPKRRVVLLQTQAENAGAQEITRLLGKGLNARGYEVLNLFFYRKSDSFEEPLNTLYCSSGRPETRWRCCGCYGPSAAIWQRQSRMRSLRFNISAT